MQRRPGTDVYTGRISILIDMYPELGSQEVYSSYEVSGLAIQEARDPAVLFDMANDNLVANFMEQLEDHPLYIRMERRSSHKQKMRLADIRRRRESDMRRNPVAFAESLLDMPRSYMSSARDLLDAAPSPMRRQMEEANRRLSQYYSDMVDRTYLYGRAGERMTTTEVMVNRGAAPPVRVPPHRQYDIRSRPFPDDPPPMTQAALRESVALLQQGPQELIRLNTPPEQKIRESAWKVIDVMRTGDSPQDAEDALADLENVLGERPTQKRGT